jgi:hypothetical protein
MRIRILGLVAMGALALTFSACSKERQVTESTGTATATVKTKAPANVVSDSELQQKAEDAADAASTPVNATTGNTTGKTTKP